MDLASESASRLQSWLAADTWHTRDRSDMQRWYRFVDQYQREHGFDLDETVMFETIEHLIEGGVNEPMREEIRHRIYVARTILDFLECTGRTERVHHGTTTD